MTYSLTVNERPVLTRYRKRSFDYEVRDSSGSVIYKVRQPLQGAPRYELCLREGQGMDNTPVRIVQGHAVKDKSRYYEDGQLRAIISQRLSLSIKLDIEVFEEDGCKVFFAEGGTLDSKFTIYRGRHKEIPIGKIDLHTLRRSKVAIAQRENEQLILAVFFVLLGKREQQLSGGGRW